MVVERWVKMENILYLTTISAGFIILFIFILFLNKKYTILSIENCIYSYIIFLIIFILFSKIIHLFIDFDLNSMSYLLSNNIYDKLKFVFSGYSFIGGYIGGLLVILVLSKLFKKDKLDIMLLYIPNIIIMYSIMKIGCYIKGCCYGVTNIPIQLIETFINLIAFIYILILINKNKEKNIIVGLSFILFGSLRFMVSIFRVFVNKYTFIFIELFCLFLIILGIKIMMKCNNCRTNIKENKNFIDLFKGEEK